MSGTAIEIPVVLFLAAFARSALGFGEALIAVPILALVIPVQVAAPIAVLSSITVAATILLRDWRHVHVESAGWLIASTLVGTPFGLILLTRVPSAAAKACLGLALLGFGSYALLHRRPVSLANDRLAWLFGFAAGVLGGAFGMNGPPVVIYGSLRGWSPQRFRATLQGYFLPASAMAMAGYWTAGLWTSEVTRYYLYALPGVLVAVFLGRTMHSRMDTRSFGRVVNLGLLAIAGLLLVQSLRALR